MLRTDLDLPEIGVQEFPEHLVVVSGDEHHPGALACLAQQLLHHVVVRLPPCPGPPHPPEVDDVTDQIRSEEHTSELQSLMRISYAVFCLTKKNKKTSTQYNC